MKTCHPIRSFGLAAALLLPALSAQAAPITLPSAPLYLAGGVAPNLVVTLDDSGSMGRAYVPDSLVGYTTTKRYRSSTFNALAYNPASTYLPPLQMNGTPYSTSFTAAFINGFDPSRGSVDLSTSYKATVGYYPQNSTQNTAAHPDGTTTGTAAYYYVYDPVSTGCSPAATTDDACYVKVVVGSTEQQNFANWYSFYRTRNLTTVSAATRAFNNLPATMRLAWQALNTSCDDFTGSACKGWDGVSRDNRIRTLSATGHKQNFYDWLVKLPADGLTPLRAALGRVGEYYSTASGTDPNNPYAQDPQVDVGTQHSCRANYSVMMTDGMWNGSAASKVSDSDNVDGTGKSLPDGTAYTPSPPYADQNLGSLADVAFYYWAKDLRGDLTNNVPRNPRSLDKLVEDGKPIPAADYFDAKNDPASWQHMVTFTVGLGLTSSLSEVGLTWAGDTYQGSYADLVSGVKSWPKTADNQPGNVADLWHAAINGRGLFFSAEDPQTLGDAMQEVVNNIISRSSSAASIATNSRRLDTSTNIYQASFDSGNWTGELEAFSIKADGTLGSSLWTASSRIPAAADRNIKTFNGTAGADFAWGSLSPAQQTALGSADVLNYLRGDQSKEQSKGGTYRNRTSLLGDIINSDPLFVSEENFGYDKLAGSEGTDYVTYLAGKSARNPMIYVGANDGMLHAFSARMGWKDTDSSVDSDGDGNKTNDKNESVATADSGKELFAYVPALVYANLRELTKPGYGNNHKYFVDGAPTMGDVYYGGATWKTVLVTPLGAGGRGVFALDISKDYATSAFDATDVLWEFDGASAAAGSTLDDMGYPVGSAAIGRFNDGKYYAVFGNGYGSANCKSALYMVQIDDPANVKFFDTGKGDCTSSASQNGMSPPSLVDYDGDRIIDAIFAGDLLGNLWKFDVSATTWQIALGGPMFTAPAGQAITAPVEVGPAPSGASGKAMVYFGTGRYLLSGDETSTAVQTFYGLLDADKVVAPAKLNKQSIGYEDATARVVFDGNDGTVNWSSQHGWYLDLLPPSGTAQGERVLSTALLRYGRVIFNTSIPSADPCVLGGAGWLMELDAATGSTLSYSALDMNGDGLFDEKDYVVIGKDNKGNDIKSPVAGKRSGSMSLNQPTVITAGAKEFKFNSDIKKGISVTTEKSGTSNPRSSWRQLQ